MGNLTFEQMKALPPEEQKELFAKLTKLRSLGKATNYSCQYQAGVATISRNTKMTMKQAKKLHEAYWQLNWSLKEIPNMLKTKVTSNGETWQLNPVNGFWYNLRTKKDSFSTLVQGTGAYIFDIWTFFLAKICKQRGLVFALAAQFHDEIVLRVPEGEEDVYKKATSDAMGLVNKHIKLHTTIACDIQFGKAYSEIH